MKPRWLRVPSSPANSILENKHYLQFSFIENDATNFAFLANMLVLIRKLVLVSYLQRVPQRLYNFVKFSELVGRRIEIWTQIGFDLSFRTTGNDYSFSAIAGMYCVFLLLPSIVPLVRMGLGFCAQNTELAFSRQSVLKYWKARNAYYSSTFKVFSDKRVSLMPSTCVHRCCQSVRKYVIIPKLYSSVV